MRPITALQSGACLIDVPKSENARGVASRRSPVGVCLTFPAADRNSLRHYAQARALFKSSLHCGLNRHPHQAPRFPLILESLAGRQTKTVDHRKRKRS
jgi:hypothetical protein